MIVDLTSPAFLVALTDHEKMIVENIRHRLDAMARCRCAEPEPQPSESEASHGTSTK